MFTFTFVCSLFTEILTEVHSSNDIQFSENGAWTSIRSKVSSLSKTLDSDENSFSLTVSGLYYFRFFQLVKVLRPKKV